MSPRADLMARKTTNQSLPVRNLPRGYFLKKKSAQAAALKLRGGNAAGALTYLGGAAGRAMRPSAERAAALLMAAAADAGTDLVGKAAGAAQVLAAKKVAEAVESISQKKDTMVKGVQKAFAREVTLATSGLMVQKRPYNNAVVPDKTYSLSVTQGKMTPRETKFYTRWPKQSLLLYQSKTLDRLVHTASPGNKSFYSPYYTSYAKLPAWVLCANYRKGVEVDQTPVTGLPTTEPPFLVSNTNYGVVQGGQDFVANSLTLGGWTDIISCVSAMTPTTMPSIPDNFRVGGNYKLKFGIPKMNLSFHIENLNSFLPAYFTVQVHQFQGSDRGPGIDNPNPGYTTPLTSIFSTSNSTVPRYARSFVTNSSAFVANDPALSTTDYISENSLLLNAPTFASNSFHAFQWKIVGSQKVKLTAGGRLKVSLSLAMPPINILDYMTLVGSADAQQPMRNRELHVTILAHGAQEVVGDIYFNGLPRYSSNFMSNPVQYTITNVRKTAEVYAPQLNIQTLGTTGYEAANVQFVNYVDNLFAFGESKISQFVPEGQYDIPFADVTDFTNIVGSSGFKVIFPLLTDQVKSATSSRLAA